ncbi:hypothetical protein [Chondrinema litorale]|uniref:hypothetical protein n=1 Tax=Chondrinema litorale TaxID=2994555 RepID=UPI002543F78D|nr:hypothetical protein [Chondrinema litorale]UZR98837.1 hypothetical protein OQ292_33130 [Chondrinema litorale]
MKKPIEIKINYFKHIVFIIFSIVFISGGIYSAYFTEDPSLILKITMGLAIPFLSYWAIVVQLKTIFKRSKQIIIRESDIEFYTGLKKYNLHWKTVKEIEFGEEIKNNNTIYICEIITINGETHKIYLNDLDHKLKIIYKLIKDSFNEYQKHLAELK